MKNICEYFEPLTEERKEFIARRIDAIKSWLETDKVSFKSIVSIGIMSLESSIFEEDFKNILRTRKLPWIPVDGKIEKQSESEHSAMIINISLEEMQDLAGYFEQTSFIFIEPNGPSEITCSYYEKERVENRYDNGEKNRFCYIPSGVKGVPGEYISSKNIYVVKNKDLDVCNIVDIFKDKDIEEEGFYTIMGPKYKFKIPFKRFKEKTDKINENLDYYVSDHTNRLDILTSVMSPAVLKRWYTIDGRSILYRGLLDREE